MACECCEAAASGGHARGQRVQPGLPVVRGALHPHVDGARAGAGGGARLATAHSGGVDGARHAEAQLRELAAADAMPLDPQPWRRGGAR